MSLLTIDESRCTRCGLCAQDCVPRVIAQTGTDVPAIKYARTVQRDDMAVIRTLNL